MSITKLYQAFELNIKSVDDLGRSAELSTGAKNFGEIEDLKRRLESRSYKVLTSNETYNSLPRMILLKTMGNTRLGSPKQSQIQRDFQLENKTKIPYTPKYFFISSYIEDSKTTNT